MGAKKKPNRPVRAYSLEELAHKEEFPFFAEAIKAVPSTQLIASFVVELEVGTRVEIVGPSALYSDCYEANVFRVYRRTKPTRELLGNIKRWKLLPR